MNNNEKLRECPVCGNKSYIKTPDTDSRRRYHKFECPKCKVIITHKYAGDLLRLLDMPERMRHTPTNETVEQWEERTGETYPDDGPVWHKEVLKDDKGEYIIYNLMTLARYKPYGSPEIIKKWLEANQPIVATHHGKPDKP